jgi:Nucleotidyl transferase AbiEii toxin, Type IV TA system
MGLSQIEEVYFQAWGKAGGSGRVRRAFSMFDFMRQMLTLQVKDRMPALSPRELSLQTAKRIYCSDVPAQRLLDTVNEAEMSVDDFPETIERILEILDALEIRFHVTGGIAASYYGDPRYTQDLDIVVDLAVGRPETAQLLARLSQSHLIARDVVIQAIQQKGLFQAIDSRSMIKIDFHVGEKIPGELTRTTRREIAPGLFAPLVSKEDSILSKLYWIQQGSHRSRRDVTEMLRRDEDFDPTILKQRAAALGLLDLLDEMDREMREGPRLA